MSAALADALAGDLLRWLEKGADGVRRQVILWLDPESQFRRLLPHVEPALQEAGATLLTLAGPTEQLGLKLALLRLEQDCDRRAVVYLAGFGSGDLAPRGERSPVLWSVYDYRYKGCVWGLGDIWQPGSVAEPPTLPAWLRWHGVRIADSGAEKVLTADGPDSLLSRYAALNVQLPLSGWPSPLRRADVEQELGGDPRQQLRRLIIDADGALAAWDANVGAVLGGIREAFSLELGPDAGPGKMADEAAVQLALAEAWQALGEAAEFPFAARLPGDVQHRRALASFLRNEILPNDEARAAYRERIRRLEPQYDLWPWAKARSGSPAGLPGLARQRWQQFLSELDRAAEEGWESGRKHVLAHQDLIAAEQHCRWTGDGDGPQWQVAADLLTLCRAASSAMQGAPAMKTAAAMVGAYAGDWWQIDWLHLVVRDACSQNPDLERVAEIADNAYFDYAATVNDRFTLLIEAEACWPPAGTTGIADVRSSVWLAGSGRRAVIISDALRWDLASQVTGQRAGYEARSVVSTLPSITPYGMTAMLPLREGEPDVRWPGGPSLKDRKGRSLAERAGRRAVIKEALEAEDRTVEFLEMNALLRSKKAPAADVTVVFDTNIDAQGHQAVANFPAVARKLVSDIRRSIEKLHSFGIQSVHVLTDHGFLMLPTERVDALGHPELPAVQCTKKEGRWVALKPDVAAPDLIRLPLPIAPGAGVLGFPHGVQSLTKAEPYMHGGVSLQECVIPHLVATASMPVVRVRPLVTVSQDVLTTGTVSFSLRPAPLTQPPLGGVEPLFVRLLVEIPGDPPKQVATAKEEELRQDVEEIKGAMFLLAGCRLPAGAALQLRCLDRETGEELVKVHLTLAIDWE
jgi:hypothetical protein